VTVIRATTPIVRPSDDEIAAAADVLNRAGAVTILAGAGCRGAHDELIAIAERLKAPVVHALRGKEFVEYDNPYDVGMTGLLGFASGYRAMEHCDTLLMLGTDFPYRPFYPDNARIVQVDIRGENIGRRVPVDVALVGGVRDTVAALLPRLRESRDDAHLTRMTAHYRRTRKRLDALTRSGDDSGPLHPQVVTAAIDRLAAGDAAFVPDVGTPTLWAARHLTMNGRRRLIGSFTHGSMANALPQAIGIQAAYPARQVVALSGDGGLAMLLGELLTLRQQRLPVKVVVLNNGALSFVELEMKADGILNYGTDLDNPDFAEVARAVGLYGARVERPGELDDALRTAFDHPGPAVVDVLTRRQSWRSRRRSPFTRPRDSRCGRPEAF
jgi:pyruvate dehydrogenase (quinone)